MTANRRKWPGAILIAILALSVCPTAGRADFVAAAFLGQPAAVSCPTRDEPDDADEDSSEESRQLAELKLAMLVLLIGDVPAVNLNFSTTTYTGSSSDPGGSIVSGGSDPTGSDSTTPATTPEPTSWLLGLLGSGMAGVAGVFKRNFVATRKSARA